jgi:hypothetical protein
VILIGTWKFARKIDVERRVRAILCSHGNNQVLTGDADLFIRALIELHPNHEAIVDCGISWIFVQHIENGWRRFAVRRKDESLRDFSWRKSIYPRSDYTRLASPARGAIHDQITAYRDRNYAGRCDLCTVPISLEECHVDHAGPTFKQLLESWLYTVRLTAADVEIRVSTKYEFWTKFADPVLEQSWQEYHEINARLRCLCAPCNLSVTRTSPKVFHAR